jgi:hypothetical protein
MQVDSEHVCRHRRIFRILFGILVDRVDEVRERAAEPETLADQSIGEIAETGDVAVAIGPPSPTLGMDGNVLLPFSLARA